MLRDILDYVFLLAELVNVDTCGVTLRLVSRFWNT